MYREASRPADDLGRLSRCRDGFPVTEATPGQSLVELVNALNAEGVSATRRLSPEVLLDLLRLSDARAQAFFATLDPLGRIGVVSWAGAARPWPSAVVEIASRPRGSSAASPGFDT